MHTEPQVDQRAAQPYMAIRTQITMGDLGSGLIPQLLGEVFAWLGARGIAPAGPPLIRYRVIDMARRLEVDLGVPVAQAAPGDGRVQSGELPAGRYASLIYTNVTQGVPANRALLEWGAAQGLVWDRWETPQGDGWGGRVEFYLDGPADDPDPAHWRTEVAIRIADAAPA